MPSRPSARASVHALTRRPLSDVVAVERCPIPDEPDEVPVEAEEEAIFLHYEDIKRGLSLIMLHSSDLNDAYQNVLHFLQTIHDNNG